MTVGRARVLSDAVSDLAAQVRDAKTMYMSSKKITVDGAVSQKMDGVMMAINNLARQVEQVNANLNRLSQSPILGIGTLIGRGEQDIQALTRSIDALISVVRDVMSAVKH